MSCWPRWRTSLHALQFAGKGADGGGGAWPRSGGVELRALECTGRAFRPHIQCESADTGGLSATAALHMGRVLVAQLGPDEFLVAGIDARVNFRLTPPAGEKQAQLVDGGTGNLHGNKLAAYSFMEWR